MTNGMPTEPCSRPGYAPFWRRPSPDSGPSSERSSAKISSSRSLAALARRSWPHLIVVSKARGSISVRAVRNACAGVPSACCNPGREWSAQIPHTSINVPLYSSLCRNTFSFHGFLLRSKITRWPASAPHRSM